MAYFLTWNEWRALRESNARKRAVRAALNGTGPSLPGSYAACPSTNAQAMDGAQKTGVVKKKARQLRSESSQPDYSFDRWLQMAQELGDDVNKLVGHGKEEEDKLEKKKQDDSKKQSEKPEPKESPNKDDDPAKGKEDKWERLRQMHKERAANDSTKHSKKTSEGSREKSDGRSSSTDHSQSSSS